MPRVPSGHLPPSPGPRGVAGRLVSLAKTMRLDASRVPKRRKVAPPPPPPPVQRPVGIAALIPRPEVLLPPRIQNELPPPPVVPHPIGLAAKIPPLARRTLVKSRPAP